MASFALLQVDFLAQSPIRFTASRVLPEDRVRRMIPSERENQCEGRLPLRKIGTPSQISTVPRAIHVVTSADSEWGLEAIARADLRSLVSASRSPMASLTR